MSDPLGLVPAIDLTIQAFDTLQLFLTEPCFFLLDSQLLLVLAIFFFSFCIIQFDLVRGFDQAYDEMIKTVFKTLLLAIRLSLLDIVYPRFDVQDEDSGGIVLVSGPHISSLLSTSRCRYDSLRPNSIVSSSRMARDVSSIFLCDRDFVIARAGVAFEPVLQEAS